MTAEDFRKKRRQKFLTEQYYVLNVVDLAESQKAHHEGIANRQARGSLEPAGQGGIFGDKLKMLKLHYTAGCDIEDLKPLYADALVALESWTKAYRAYIRSMGSEADTELRDDGTPLIFEDLYHYQLALDITSLGVLLGDARGVQQVADSVDRYRGTDLLFESLIGRVVSDPRTNTDFFHTEPYDPLIDAFYTAEEPSESIAFMKRYLEGWYKAFEGTPGHNGHLKSTPEYMPYYGYWSFEAAAISVLFGIDDADFRNQLVYPKDLADWARANGSVERLTSTSSAGTTGSDRLRCESGQRCPRSGYWVSPAKANSRHHFQQGDTMPALGGDYGTTIWQWDENQAS